MLVLLSGLGALCLNRFFGPAVMVHFRKATGIIPCNYSSLALTKIRSTPMAVTIIAICIAAVNGPLICLGSKDFRSTLSIKFDSFPASPLHPLRYLIHFIPGLIIPITFTAAARLRNLKPNSIILFFQPDTTLGFARLSSAATMSLATSSLLDRTKSG